MSVEKLILTISRASIQGGIPNERYPKSLLYDVRLTHHITTDAVEQWKGYECAGRDSKFTDIRCRADPKLLAEGKTINVKRGVCLKPSVDTGGGRKFNPENLKRCFEKNTFYYFYQTVSHDETSVTFHIYWVPIQIVKDLYEAHGKNGLVPFKPFMNAMKVAPENTLVEFRA